MHDFTDGPYDWGQQAGRLTRRQFGRIAALLSADTSLPFYNEPALAQDLKVMASIPPDAARLNTNENPMGPCPAALDAIRDIIPQGG
jgi:histidinol-phosphate aminotransferase